MKKQTEKMIFKPSLSYKMSREEVQNLLHMKRKGTTAFKNKKTYSRKEKYRKTENNNDNQT